LNSKIFEKLYETVKFNTSDFVTVGRAEVDSVLVLSSPISGQLPIQFLKVLEQLDEGFNLTAIKPDLEFNRLLAILDAHRFVSQHEGLSIPHSLPSFQLEPDDKSRVLKLCSDMRKIILATPDFDNAHRVRLSNRISAIESEVHKEKGMFDVVLGGVSDLGETLGKFGKDIKPLSDRMAEITKLTRGATKEYDQIPAPEEVKQLPKPDEEESAE